MAIPMVAPIAPDEAVTGWVNYLAELNLSTYYDFMKYFFQSGIRSKNHISNLAWACDHYRNQRFPDLKEILLHHCPASTDAIILSPYHAGVSLDNIINVFNQNDMQVKVRGLQYCPACAEEDLEQYGRVIAHVPHQLRYVTCCHKHGIRLSQDPGAKEQIPASDDDEMFWAEAMHKLYQSGVTGTVRTLTDMLHTRDKLLTTYVSNNAYYTNLLPALRLLGVDTIISAYAVLQDAHLSKATEALAKTSTVIRCDYPIIRCKCNQCGHDYTIHVLSAMAGMSCPYCDRDLDKRSLLNKRLSCLYDNQYSIVQLGQSSTIKRNKCGHVFSVKIDYLLRRAPNCPCCVSEGRVGETAVMHNGMSGTIIAYHSSQNVDVQMDGYIKKHCTYASFRAGSVGSEFEKAKYRKTRIGETRIMKCGLEATIIDYRHNRDIDVKFSTGDIRTHVTYANFRKGVIRLPAQDVLLGETRIMKCGLQATIIAKSRCTIKVQFSNGKVRRNCSYTDFLNGDLEPWEDRNKRYRIGEERIMNCGLKAKITEYIDCNHMTLQFEDGSVRTAVPYRFFKKGMVRPPHKRSSSQHSQQEKETQCN